MHRRFVAVRHLRIVASLVLALSAADAFSQRTAAVSPPAKELVNSLGMKFTTISPGEFLMGASPEEIDERKEQLIKRGGDDDGNGNQRDEITVVESEGPQRRVTIGKPLRLGTYEVTQAEFQAVTGFNPSSHSATGSRKNVLTGLDTRRHPVDRVSWSDAVEFCRLLSSLDEEIAAGRTYRLPTEAEWEYAYRAGTTTKFFWGEDRGKQSADWTKYPKVGTGKKATTVPVGSLKPNPWGLHDMQGNAREWCADWFDPQAYAKGAAGDPTGPATGVERVVRGGVNPFFPPASRSAARRKLAPDAVNHFSGFRVVCVQVEVPKIVSTTAVPALIEAQLKQKGLVRQGTLFVLADEAQFVRFTATLERMRVACFNARREVDDAKKQLQRVSSATAGALEARVAARNTMRYSDTWREHRLGVVSRNMATDALALINMSREDVASWLADAQADYDAAVSRFAEQCKTLRDMHGRLQTKQREVAADSEVTKALAAAGGKTTFRIGPSPTAAASLKKLEHEESVLKQLQVK